MSTIYWIGLAIDPGDTCTIQCSVTRVLIFTQVRYNSSVKTIPRAETKQRFAAVFSNSYDRWFVFLSSYPVDQAKGYWEYRLIWCIFLPNGAGTNICFILRCYIRWKLNFTHYFRTGIHWNFRLQFVTIQGHRWFSWCVYNEIQHVSPSLQQVHRLCSRVAASGTALLAAYREEQLLREWMNLCNDTMRPRRHFAAQFLPHQKSQDSLFQSQSRVLMLRTAEDQNKL